MNYSIVNFEPADGYSGSFSANGDIGAQLGLGFIASDKLAFEIYSWVTSAESKSTTSTEHLDYGKGLFPSIRIAAKYLF